MSIERRLRREQSRQQAKLKNKLKDIFGGEKLGGKLTAFGAFYKDSDDDGFSMFVSIKDMSTDLWDLLVDYVGELEAAHKEAKAVTYKNWEELDLPSETWEDYRQDENDETVEYLQEKIKIWNILAYGSETRPPRGDIRDIEFSSEVLRTFLVIVCLIYDLEQEGVIVSDNFNGMIYHYMSDGITTIE